MMYPASGPLECHCCGCDFEADEMGVDDAQCEWCHECDCHLEATCQRSCFECEGDGCWRCDEDDEEREEAA